MVNSLANETSPYLLQHAENPVNWYAWTAEALKLAQKEDKPILLSIGYAACHWCHVMEHESFQDQATADIMNRHFICIKVDREERPDLDKIYQMAYQMLNHKPGGWPLNLFLTPENQVPFFAGTYFPPDTRYGMPPFKDILQRISKHFQQYRPDLQQQSQQIQSAFNDIYESKTSASDLSITDEPLQRAANALADSFDETHGGFGAAPKFPHPANLQRCLYYSSFCHDQDTAQQLLEMCQFTLNRMSEGGLNDHVGGGFYRYSTDELWMIPHFEKMLYDNAQLIPLYIETAKVCNDPEMLTIADKICSWVYHEMQSTEGGYYSSLDADSEGEEGRFYVWKEEEIRKHVSPRQWQLLRSRYGLRGKANFEGSWHLHAVKSLQSLAVEYEMDNETVRYEIDDALHLLKCVRSERVWPDTDDKILTAWNGMMIAAMAQAGDALEKKEYIHSAEKSLAFIRQNLWQSYRLKVTSRNSKSQLNAYLDDYVLLASGLFELLKVRWSSDDMLMLIQLLDSVLEHFEDHVHGAFFFTSDDHEKLLSRIKPDTDDAIPSGNGIAAQLLLQIGLVTGEQRYLAAAENTLRALWKNINRFPVGHSSLLSALEYYLKPPDIIILRGKGDRLEEWRLLAKQFSRHDQIILAIPDNAENLPVLLAAKESSEKGVIAYPCQGSSCYPAITDKEEFQKYLGR